MKSTKFWLATVPLFISLALLASNIEGVKSEIKPLSIDRGDAIGGYLVFDSCVTRYEASMNCRDNCRRTHGENRAYVLDESSKDCEMQYYTPIACYCVK